MKQKVQAVFDDDSFAHVTFTIPDTLHRDNEGENFIIAIYGEISIVDFDGVEKEAAGKLSAQLIQFNQAEARGISHRWIGDGRSQQIREYWCELFVDKDEFVAGIRRRWHTMGNNLLIIDSLETLPKFEEYGLGLAALTRTIEVFGPSCNLVASYPDAMMRFSKDASDLPGAIALLKKHCQRLGFREWNNSGIYLLNPSTPPKEDLLLE